ncbi:PTS system D-fructose-specific IIB component (F1P-forming) (Frc family) /PTS system D-fructose-specific IIC component (F1P-forming) (Frc family) [Oceanotoga teriensis]|uniref:PTS system D-fructose-specific IIB component (F1P-forming) (Frc family) /PTS system D-fructose-specific IIC component (F1P-forming) (Frc family) n=1 Tax=Oceanotoga teriensis TaxID=515440 RepID=A0AA45C7P2_9BACT|nr:fructose-specific PTS transporter subunit EIIC [Oceanotoga teriensis]PWJ95513.1 PTS system D-fructose-specific IIB component (F1P-forming) (Frc family) /PTS system D-fructose-specific IIC component (F1P-forming) (Frc family) [Oceanotoga teriensis]
MSKRLVAVTSCPTGIAHTYMASEALRKAAEKLGYEIKVETRGSVGVENELKENEIKNADAVILAVDVNVSKERFIGKKIFETSVAQAIKDPEKIIENSLNSDIKSYTEKISDIKSQRSKEKKGVYKHLMSGVSYMIPFVVAGGLLIALSFLFGGYTQEGEFAKALATIGNAAFKLMIPILAGYVAFSIGDRAALVPGMVGGLIAADTKSGFLGALVAGFIAGYIVKLMKKTIKLPKGFEGLMPVLIIPLISTFLIGIIMIFVIGTPMTMLNESIETWLKSLTGTNAIILGVIIGLMMAIDMGGPINKAAYAFGISTIGNAEPSAIMAAVMAAGMIPPLGIALSTVLFKNKYNFEEKEAGKAAWVLGISFITEGAIPFAAADPLRVIPSIMAGSALTGALSMLFNVTLPVPHGGIFVFWAVDGILGYSISIIAGMILTALLLGILKSKKNN